MQAEIKKLGNNRKMWRMRRFFDLCISATRSIFFCLRETFLKPCDDAILRAHPVGNWLNHARANRNVKEALLTIEKDFPQTLF